MKKIKQKLLTKHKKVSQRVDGAVDHAPQKELKDLPHEAPFHEEHAGRKIRPVLSWHGPEYVQHAKGLVWFTIAGIIAFLSILASFFGDNWSLALAIATFAVVYIYLYFYHPPQEITVTVALDGIHAGERFFPYSHIEAFWIFDHHGVKTLNLRIRKRWWSDVVVQLNDQDPVAVRHFLVTQIPEWEGKHERLSDIVLRLLKL